MVDLTRGSKEGTFLICLGRIEALFILQHQIRSFWYCISLVHLLNVVKIDVRLSFLACFGSKCRNKGRVRCPCSGMRLLAEADENLQGYPTTVSGGHLCILIPLQAEVVGPWIAEACLCSARTKPKVPWG